MVTFSSNLIVNKKNIKETKIQNNSKKNPKKTEKSKKNPKSPKNPQKLRKINFFQKWSKITKIPKNLEKSQKFTFYPERDGGQTNNEQTKEILVSNLGCTPDKSPGASQLLNIVG